MGEVRSLQNKQEKGEKFSEDGVAKVRRTIQIRP